MDRILILLVLAGVIGVIATLVWLVRGRGISTLGRLRHQHQHQHQHPLEHEHEAEDEDLDELSPKERQLKNLCDNELFWGVVIQQGGCNESKSLASRHFTFGEAPALPLRGCDAPVCSCQYKGLKEVRSEHRRVQEDRRDSLRFDAKKPDRRSLKDRRRRFDSWKGRA